MSRRRRIIQLTLLLLLPLDCAWADNDIGRQNDRHGVRLASGENVMADSLPSWRAIMPEPSISRQAGAFASGETIHDVDEIELRRRTPTTEEAAQITQPPISIPELLKRQSQQQIDDLNSRLQSVQQSAQQALQQLSDSSRQVSQASQQLSQSSQQLSQQSGQLQQQSQLLSQSLQQAKQDAQQASQSFDRALSSAQSSAASAIASATSSAGASASAAIAQAASQVRVAQADSTLVRVRRSLLDSSHGSCSSKTTIT